MHRIALIVLICFLAAPEAASACGLGRPLAERVLIRPQPSTFYTQDALNPDVVFHNGKYRLYFSGNTTTSTGQGSWQTGGGRWVTGVAVSTNPLGPFKVHGGRKGDFLNGGTAVRDGRYFQAASVAQSDRPYLYTSRDGIDWNLASIMPAPPRGVWRAWQSDLYLRPNTKGLDAYFAARPGPAGADIGSATFRRNTWDNFRVALRKGAPGTWDSFDLGEPALFRGHRNTYMLYVGNHAAGKTRQIGLAIRKAGKWVRCSDQPVIRAGGSWYSKNAIDPAPIVVGNKLYVYFGGGITPSAWGSMNGTIGVRVFKLPS